MTPLAPDSHANAPQGERTTAVRRTWPRLTRLMLKELRETLRDRRTIATLVLMPALVYPLLSLGFQKLMVSSYQAASEGERRLFVGIEDPSHDRQLQKLFGFRLNLCEDLKRSVAQHDMDVGVRVLQVLAPPPGRTETILECEILYREDYDSRVALDFVEDRLEAQLSILLSPTNKTEKVPVPKFAQRSEVKSAGRGIGLSLAALVPLVLILMTITGAVYPAIDLTAGERERGTLETLIAAPVPRLGLLVAKYVAVLTVALLTATVNLTAMTITVYSLGLRVQVFGGGGLTLGLVAQVFGLLFLFAAFFSAVLSAVTSFARSFKEAQAYLIPLMLMSIAPGLLSLNENLHLTGPLAVTPLLNIVLLGRDLFAGTANPLLAVVVILSTLLYAMAALTVAAYLFGTDAILYGSHGTWSELFRRPREPEPVAGVSLAVFCLAIVFPAYVVVQGFQAQAAFTMSQRLTNSILWSALLFGGIPALVAILRNVNLAGAMGFWTARWLDFAGAMLLGLSLWPLMHELVVLQQGFGISLVNPALIEQASQLLRELKRVPFPLVLLSIAIAPAVFEELLFRGLLLQALLPRMSPARAVLASALAFGAFHILLFGNLTLARVLPTTCMGLVLGFVCYRSGSVLPGMLLHACYNGMLVSITYHIEWLNVESWGIEAQPHLPWHWLLFAALGTLAGFGAIWLARRK